MNSNLNYKSIQAFNRSLQLRSYFDGGTLTIMPISHKIMDPTIQDTSKKTKKPAKTVRNGGPWGASLVLIPLDFSLLESPEGIEFDADATTNLCLFCNLAVFLNLNERN